MPTMLNMCFESGGKVKRNYEFLNIYLDKDYSIADKGNENIRLIVNRPESLINKNVAGY
jgi:hypothetical protein